MLRLYVLRFATIVLSLAASGSVWLAQTPLEVPLASGVVEINGILGEAEWSGAAVIDGFYETSPSDNTTPAVKTVAYLMYDDRHLYIGVRADDPNPENIRAPFVERDGVLGTDDNVAVFLDTHNDKRSAVQFRVNPRGAQGDAVFNDATATQDFGPDFFFDTAAQIGSRGWSAELRIPFMTLRYGPERPQTWSILVWRNYPRQFRYAFHSAEIPRGSQCLLCHSHPISLADLPGGGHLVVVPYATAEQLAHPRSSLGSALRNETGKVDGGIDVKWTPGADHAIDVTINPDFSHVEADVTQITANARFAVFYPEKRPFFLESVDLFETPFQVAYTRTITAPRFGVRATGRQRALAYTLLLTNDRGGGLTLLPGPLSSSFALQSESYSLIGRMRLDVGASYVGAIVTDREVEGGGHNRVLGSDFQFRPNAIDSVSGQFLLSETDARRVTGDDSLRSYAASGTWFRQRRTDDWLLRARAVGDDFRADLGFIPQVGYREIAARVAKRIYPKQGLLRYFRASASVERQTQTNGDVISEAAALSLNGTGAKALYFLLNAYPGKTVRVGDVLLRHSYVDLLMQMDPSRFTQVTWAIRAGQAVDLANGRVGDGASTTFTTTWRPHDRLELKLHAAREWLDVDGGRLFSANVGRVRAQYSFSQKALLRVIAQYTSDKRDPTLYTHPVSRQDGGFTGSVLGTYRVSWQTVIFIGYGDDRTLTETGDLVKTGRSVFVKGSYALTR